MGIFFHVYEIKAKVRMNDGSVYDFDARIKAAGLFITASDIEKAVTDRIEKLAGTRMAHFMEIKVTETG